MTDPRGFAGMVKRAKTKDRCYLYVKVGWDLRTRCALKAGHSEPCAIAVSPMRLPASSPTGAAAARQVREERAADQRARIIVWLERERGGLTDEELQESAEMSGDAERPRRWQLVKDGVVRDSGRTRKTSNGVQAVVWELVPDDDPLRDDPRREFSEHMDDGGRRP